MIMSKKIVSFILSASMTFGMGAQAFAAIANDAKESKYADSIEVLNALEIMVGDAETGAFRPEDTIRRSEFAKVAVTAMGMGDLADSSNSKTPFPDVVENHWANGYINVAANQGLVIGDDNGNFRPDDSITYAEAATVLVRLIGHTPAAEKKGGFPTGYVSVATQQGITKNAVAANNTPILRGMVAKMTDNTLTVKKMEQTSYGGDESYGVVDKTLLGDDLKTKILRGQITAVGASALNGNGTLRNDEIKIGDNVYRMQDSIVMEAGNLLGFHVEAYVRENDSEEEFVILARAEKSKNNTVSVLADNVAAVKEGEKLTIEYWKDKDNDTKTKTVEIASDAKYMLNGKATVYSKELLQPESGSVTLLDTDRDDIYDIVFVESYENYVVDQVVLSSNRITDKYGKSSLVLDPEDKEVKFVITRKGRTLSLSDIKEWDVLSVSKSTDKSIVMIEVTSEAVNGKVTERHENKVGIDGKEYKIAANYTDAVRLNDEGTFYLDKDGNIAAVDTTRTLSANYAYLISADLTSGFDKNLQLKVFDKNGKTKVVTAGEKIRFNGKSATLSKDVLAQLKNESGLVENQLITFELNGDGVLTRLDTAKDHTDTGKIDKESFSVNAEGTLRYREASKKLGQYNLTEETIVFDIPNGETDADKFSVTDRKLFEDDTDYDVFVYDAAEDLTAKAVVVTNSNGIANLDAAAAVVEKITTTVNEREETVQKLYAFVNGERKTFETAEDGILVNADGNGLKAGDIIQMRTDSQNKIESIRVLFETDNKDVEKTETVKEDLEIVYGKVTKKFANSVNVSVNGGKVANYAISNAVVYECNTSKTTNPVKVAEAGDIPQYDELDPSRVFIKIYKHEVKEIVIVR